MTGWELAFVIYLGYGIAIVATLVGIPIAYRHLADRIAGTRKPARTGHQERAAAANLYPPGDVQATLPDCPDTVRELLALGDRARGRKT